MRARRFWMPAAVTAAIVLAGCSGEDGSSADKNPDQPGLELEGVGSGVAASSPDSLTSDTRVALSAETGAADDGGSEIRVRLDVDKGWHINANPASLDFLTPTGVSLSIDGGPASTEPVYPEATTLEVPLGDGAIDVYRGSVPIRLPDLPKASAWREATVQVSVQACNDKGRCLAPATITETVQANQ